MLQILRYLCRDIQNTVVHVIPSQTACLAHVLLARETQIYRLIENAASGNSLDPRDAYASKSARLS